MKGPLCYQCRTTPALSLGAAVGSYRDAVAFCSLDCAASYGLGMMRAGGLRWCYVCLSWTGFGVGGCVRCGLTQQQSAAAANRGAHRE